MLKMTAQTQEYLEKNCVGIPWDAEHLNELLDRLDDLMLDTLDDLNDYAPTEATKAVRDAFDDLLCNN